ncbi:MAG: RNA-binding S4 domain-containing protein [Clostridia bacterium]|nr:RNA-binding S4 domain-containing protein [Clostridia bacterium]
MRLDKFLKVSRILKRRTVANEVCSSGKVEVNGRAAKPATKLNVGDVVCISYAGGKLIFKVLDLKETVKKDEAESLYEVISG